MKPVTTLVRFQFCFGEQATHMATADTLHNALFDQFIG
jgi:hypothetical protein